MAPSRKSGTQAGDWRWPAQTTPYTRAVHLPNGMLHPIVPGADVPFASSPAAVVPSQAGPTGYFVPSQPTATVPPHAVHTRYIRAPPPPPARHLFANQRPPQKPSGQVTQPSVLDRVSSRRNILTAEAKPFVGSAHGMPSAAAPATASTEHIPCLSCSCSTHFHRVSLIACCVAYTQLSVCVSLNTPLASVLVRYLTERCETGSGQPKHFKQLCFGARAAVNLTPSHSGVLSFLRISSMPVQVVRSSTACQVS